MGDWIAFWDSEHSIYVNARHRDVHYRTIAQDIRAHLPVEAAVLDYGCGEALHADLIAASAKALILCEAAPKVRAVLARRFLGHTKIKVCAPDEIAALPARSLDAVVLHSVAQYLTPQELDALLATFHRLLNRSEEHTSELQSRRDLVCRLLLEKKKKIRTSSRDQEKKQQNKSHPC